MARDAIVIGSGPAGVHAARALMDGGWSVTIVDGGKTAPNFLRDGTDPGHFEDVRRNDPMQWSWFLGSDASNIPLAGVDGGHGGGMANGNRANGVRDAAAYLPVQTENAFLIQSLARGGLGAVWGAACAFLDDDSLRAAGVDDPGFEDALANVIDNIGVSGTGRADLQPPMPLDHHAAGVLSRAKPGAVTFFQHPSAVLTRPLKGRSPNPLTDMDYYADAGKSVYRPQYTLDELIARGCTYEGGFVAESIDETTEGARVTARRMDDGTTMSWMADRVVVAAGAVNTARLLLRSKKLTDVPVPVVVKPHDLVVCADWRSLGDPGPRDRVSLCQIVGVDGTPDRLGLPSACAQLYGFRSLMLFRLLSAMPLPTPLALRVLALLSPTLVIADVRYPGHREHGHMISLGKDDTLTFKGNVFDGADDEAALKRIRAALQKTGLLPLRRVKTAIGTTSHYAGTVPVSDDEKDVLRCDKNGLVHGYVRVHVADASMFRCLPPLPHTLALMANAYRVGKAISRS